MSELSSVQARPVGRPCSTCSHPRRTEIETDLLSGALVSRVSSEFGGLSIAGLRRHRDRHMTTTAAQLYAAGLDPVDLVVRLAEIAERLHDAAEAAEQAGRVADMVRASDGQRRAIQSLLDHGVKHEEPLAMAEAYRVVARAVFVAARTNPEVAEAVAAVLDRADQPQHARDLREQFSETKGLTT